LVGIIRVKKFQQIGLMSETNIEHVLYPFIIVYPYNA